MTESNEVRSIFIDMNSYFASVEQEINPGLQGKPVAVVPMIVKNSCCIAASYEAKAFGVKTGTSLKDAKMRCPKIVFIAARPSVYVDFHNRIVAAVETCAKVSKVRSIDEMDCRLMGKERKPENAYAIARRIKNSIREKVGKSLKCSIGIAPNSLLAKIAAEMHKPDGLTLITRADLPDVLYALKLEDIPGIGDNMHKRVNNAGISTVYQLCQLKKAEMRRIWGGIVGERLWHWLKGDDVPEPDTKKRVVGHSHVLPPKFRTREKAYNVVQKLLLKAALRLRKMNYWAKLLVVYVKYIDRPSWVAKMKLEECRDDLTLLKALNLLWASCPDSAPLAVGVSLFNLTPNATLSLFENPQKTRLLDTIDKINAKHGVQTVYFGGLHDVKEAAPTRIGFTNIPDTFW